MRIAVLGLGLIGGSVALGLQRLGHDVGGHDPEALTRDAAAAAGLWVAADAAGAVDGADLVVLAAPVGGNDELLAALARAGSRALVTDVGSVKTPIVRAWGETAPPLRLVPGHPMAGAERAGWDAASPDLFDGATWVVSPGPWTTPADWATVAGLALALGAQVVPADPDDHDVAAARISHAVHVVAAALAQVAVGPADSALARSLAAGSFRDLTRVTASPPDRTTEFCFANRTPTAAVVRDVVAGLQRAEQALEAGRRDDVLAALSAGHDARLAYEGAQRRGARREVTVDPDGGDWWVPLVDLARAGAVVHEVQAAGDGLRLVVSDAGGGS